MIAWNQLEYNTQVRVLSLIKTLLSKSIDLELEGGIIAALLELEMWSNSPNYILDSDIYIAEAVEQDKND